MSDPRTDFSLRLRRLNKKRRKDLKKTRSALIDSDGYIIVRGYRERRTFPVTGLAILAVGFFGLKGAMIAQMGPALYVDKIDSLVTSDSKAVAVGMWTMQPDPVSSFVAEQIRELL